MIKIQGLTHAFGDHVVLENVEMEAPEATIMGLVGINGAGKSTLLRLMSGVYIPQQGTITYDGKSPMEAQTRKDIFLLPDDPFFTNNTNCEGLFELYKNFYPDADENVFKEMTTDYYKLPPRKPLKGFSKGMRRQAFISLAFAVAPKYLLLDEAFDGLDPLARKMFKERLKRLIDEKGSTVIISSHALKELEDFCDSYVMIDGKRLMSSGMVLEKSMDLHKYQMAFTKEIDEDTFANLPVKSLKITGHFATVVLEGSAEDTMAKLNALEPAVMDKIDVNFEEAFIDDVDRKITEEHKS